MICEKKEKKYFNYLEITVKYPNEVLYGLSYLIIVKSWWAHNISHIYKLSDMLLFLFYWHYINNNQV